MLKEFLEFVDSVLPSIDTEKKNSTLEAIQQFNFEDKELNFLASKPLEVLSQGDIISGVKFVFLDSDGNYHFTDKQWGMVLSTSCHVDQKETIQIIPVTPIHYDGWKKNFIDDVLKKNKVYDYMYIADILTKDHYVDFTIINTFNKQLIFSGIESGRIKRIASLNQMGLYLLIIKLTVYLMRKEDPETFEQRNTFG